MEITITINDFDIQTIINLCRDQFDRDVCGKQLDRIQKAIDFACINSQEVLTKAHTCQHDKTTIDISPKSKFEKCNDCGKVLRNERVKL